MLTFSFFQSCLLSSEAEEKIIPALLSKKIEILELSQEDIKSYQAYQEANPKGNQLGSYCFVLVTLNSGEQFPLIYLYNEAENTLTQIPQSVFTQEAQQAPSWKIMATLHIVEAKDPLEDDFFQPQSYATGSWKFSLEDNTLHKGEAPLQAIPNKPKLVLFELDKK